MTYRDRSSCHEAQPTHGGTHEGLSDTYSNYHDYTVCSLNAPQALKHIWIDISVFYVQIDWQPDTLTFAIDGRAVRTVKRSDTIVNGVSQYPNTPSRIQLRCVDLSILSLLLQCDSLCPSSLWPAGINTSAPGTVEWAGGKDLFSFVNIEHIFDLEHHAGMIDWNHPDYVSAGPS